MLKHTNGNSVRISYPTKAATIEAAAVYESTLSLEHAKGSAEGPPPEPARRATTRSIKRN
jgi:hypothetical protein